MQDLASQVVASLTSSKKYGDLCPDTLGRVANWAVARHPDRDEATKAAKRKLHQVHASFMTLAQISRLELLEGELPDHPCDEEVRAVFHSAMCLHTSTRERMEIMEELYPVLWEQIGAPHRVLDLACGLHPLAIPWMGLPHDVAYRGVDIDQRLARAINALLERARCAGQVDCRDLLTGLPEGDWDVALLLKALPSLEQQEKGAGLRMLSALRTRCVVVSMPARTLCGREKGMYEHYDAMISSLTAGLGWRSRQLRYPQETFYLLEH